MICRVCGSANVAKAGEVQYYLDYTHKIYDCHDCRSRFTEHADVAEALHANANSCYGLQIEMARRAKMLFDAKDLVGLERELSANSKNKFVIDTIAPYPKTARVLEVGCSRGYLTSYFILAGRDIIGADVSISAIESANASFGHRFFALTDAAISQNAPYDVIYHIGTIGCVSDPVGLTRSLLKMLKPGGKLLFNAPNADACWLRGQLWIDFAPPPDVVTLYTPGFWAHNFSDEAYVSEDIEKCSPNESCVIWLRKLMRRWETPKPMSLEVSLARYHGPGKVRTTFDKLWDIAEVIVVKVVSKAGLNRFVPRLPTPYGFYVTLTKKA